LDNWKLKDWILCSQENWGLRCQYYVEIELNCPPHLNPLPQGGEEIMEVCLSALRGERRFREVYLSYPKEEKLIENRYT